MKIHGLFFSFTVEIKEKIVQKNRKSTNAIYSVTQFQVEEWNSVI